ncbi:MAG: 50S ribosomal protein L24 [Pseudomonadota bacterium]
MNKLKSGDDVIVITGKDKGKQGQIEKVLTNGKILVSNINLVKKHVKANPNAGEAGGIIEKTMPIQASNIAIFNAATNKADRVGFKFLEDGKKVRYFKSNGEVI